MKRIRPSIAISFALVLLAATSVRGQTTVATWTFETSQPVTAGPFSPEVGAGSALGFHAGTTVYSTPAGNGSPHSFSSNGWAVGDYYQFQVATTGNPNVGLTWDQTSSNTGPRDFVLQYSTNGTSFTQFDTQYSVLANNAPNPTWNATTPHPEFNFVVDLSSITAINNQPSVYFRLVDNSTVSAAGGVVATAGTDRLDNFTVTIGNIALTNFTYWDTNGSTPGIGGTGIWDTGTSNWNNSTGDGSPTTFNSSSSAVFGGTAGTVTISNSSPGVVTANGGLEFDTNGYQITGDTLNLGTTSIIKVVNAADTATINSKISGSAGLTKSGDGTLVLGSASNDFSGVITVKGGTLSISTDANLGATSNGLVLNGGATLMVRPAADISLDANRAISGTGATIDIGDGHTLTIPGQVTMGGGLTLPNTNETLVMTNSIVALGGLTFNDTGTLKVGSSGTGPIFMAGTTIAKATSGTATIQAGTLKYGFNTATGASNGLGGTITVTNPGATLAITGPLDTTSVNAGTRIVVNGAGTIDLPHAQDSNFNRSFQIGAQGAAGPTLNIYSEANMGGNTSDQTFFNSGTLKNLSGGDLHFSTNVSFSLGGSGTFPTNFDGSGHTLTFDGPVSLFRPTVANGQNQIAVPSGTTVNFTGGWRPTATNSVGDAGTLTNTSGFAVSGGGTLNLSGTLNTLAVPVTASGSGTTVNINGTDSLNNGAALTSGTATTTVNLQLGATNGGKLNLQQANAFAGSGATPAPAKVALDGGTVGTGGVGQTFGTLTVSSANSALDVGGAGTVSFADSSGVTWGTSGPGALLRINNWASGSSHITFAGAGLLPAQQTQTHFTTYLGTGTLSSGELVPSQTTTRLWRGDLDGSGKLSTTPVVPTGADLTKLLAALADLNGYLTNNIAGGNGFGTPINTADLLDIADVNNDGTVNNADIQAEIKNVINGTLPGPSPAGGATPVPEPSTLVLGIIAGMAVAVRRKMVAAKPA